MRRGLPRRSHGPLVAIVVGVAVVAAACGSGGDSGSARSSTTATAKGATSVPTPSTVSNADFDKQAATTELIIRNAGGDPCAVIKAFAPSSSMPTPVNAQQTERGVRVIAELFTAAAATAPADAAADAAVLKQAAVDLVAEGQANRWQPSWLMSTPKSIGDTKVTQAFSNYQSVVMRTCMTQTTESP